MNGPVSRRRRPFAGALAWTCAGALIGCGPEAHREALPELEHEAVEHAEAAAAREERREGGVPTGPVVAGLLRIIPSARAVEVAGPSGDSFRVALRTPSVGHYPCTSCHVRSIGTKNVTLAQMHSERPEHQGSTRIDCYACHDPGNPVGLLLDCAECHEREGARDLMPSRTAHLTIRLGHPGGRYRNCLTCHAPENPGLLALQDGRRATLDEAYRLCAGCHFTQAQDWAGGAHGKRLAGWEGERVVLSCTGCHNPHDPKFPVRRPVTFPKIARREGLR